MYAADIDAVAAQPVHMPPPQQIRPPKPQSWGSQLWTLIRRYISVIASDKGFLGLMVILPAVLGVVSVVIPAEFGLRTPEPPTRFNGKAGTIMLILAVGMCFSGAANSVRELIKERVIYERERATGLSRSAYLMSKVIVLGVITAFQGVIICGIGFATRELPDEGLFMPPAVEICLVDHRARLHLDDVRPDHLRAGEDRREDHAAAGHVRDRPGRLHRRALPGLRLAGPGAVRLADAVALGGRRGRRHARPRPPDAAVGPEEARPTWTRSGSTRPASGASTSR